MIAFSGAVTTTPGDRQLAPGLRRNTAQYVTMPDSVKLAVALWLPADYTAGLKLPAIFVSTRYWRAKQLTFLGRALTGLGVVPPQISTAVQKFNAAGYAEVQVEARGSGASFGFRRMEWAPEEVADMTHVVEWIVAQARSNQRVGGIGDSCEGNTAELLVASGHPAVRAVAPNYDDFDPGTFTPGRVRVSGFQDMWFEGNAGLDTDALYRVLKALNESCFPSTQMVRDRYSAGRVGTELHRQVFTTARASVNATRTAWRARAPARFSFLRIRRDSHGDASEGHEVSGAGTCQAQHTELRPQRCTISSTQRSRRVHSKRWLPLSRQRVWLRR